MKKIKLSWNACKNLMKAALMITAVTLCSTNVNAQSDAWQYPNNAGFNYLRSTSVMETFKATTANNFAGFVSCSRISNGSQAYVRIMLTKAQTGAVVSTKLVTMPTLPFKDMIPTAITYNPVTKKYCVVGLAVTNLNNIVNTSPTKSWYIVMDENLNVLSRNMFSMVNSTPIVNSLLTGCTIAPTVVLTNTFVTDVCPVEADGIIVNTAGLTQNTNIATAGFAMTGVVSTGGNIAPGGDIRYVFIAKIDNTTNIVATANSTTFNAPTSDQGARILNGQEGPIYNQLQDPNRWLFPSCIIQIKTGANSNGGYFIGGTGPRRAGNTPVMGTSCSAAPSVNSGGAIAYIRRGYNLSTFTGNGNMLARKYLFGGGCCTGAIWDATANEIRVIGSVGANKIYVDKLTNVNSTPSGALGQQINIFSASSPTAGTLPCFTMPANYAGIYKLGKLFKANNPNALYGGSAKNTAITGMLKEANSPNFNDNFEVPFLTWFDWNELNTYTPATWASQGLINAGEIAFYPRVNNSGCGIMNMGTNTMFDYWASYYPDHKTAMLPFNGQGVDEQFGFGSCTWTGTSANYCVSTTEWYNYSQCNYQPDFFTNSTQTYTIDQCSPANTIQNKVNVTNTILVAPTVTTNAVLPACSVNFFREANNTNENELTSEMLVAQNTNELVITPSEGMTALKLFNLQGAIMGNYNVENNKTTINTANLATGMYILQGIDANGKTIETKKVSISK